MRSLPRPAHDPISKVALAAAAALAWLTAFPLAAQEAQHRPHADSTTTASGFGEIVFPTSAAPAAHAEFIHGVLPLHDSHDPQAVQAFRRAIVNQPQLREPANEIAGGVTDPVAAARIREVFPCEQA